MEKSRTNVNGFGALVEPRVAEYREEIAVLKETVARMNIKLQSEKGRADIAAFGKEKLLLVNKSLISKVKALRAKDLPEEYNSKLLEMQRIVERQRELVGIMCKKYVSKHDEEIKMQLIEKLKKNENILASESMEIANLEATEKDSGLCIPGSKCSTCIGSTPRSESGDCFLKERASELEEENNKLNEKIASLQKEYDLLQEKHTAVNVTHDAILNGIKEYVKKDKEGTEMKLEDLKKRAVLSEERYQMAKKHAIRMAYRMKKLNEKYEKASKELETSKEEFDVERKKFVESEDLQKKEFDDVFSQMKKQNECLMKNEEDLKEMVVSVIEEASVAANEAEEMKAQCLLKEEAISELEKANLLASKEILEERKLKEEECTAKEECAKQIVKLIIEKGQLVLNNKKLRMKKNRLSNSYERVKEDLKNQGRILEKAQESLRDLEEEKYMKRLNKRKGWRKLRFWK